MNDPDEVVGVINLAEGSLGGREIDAGKSNWDGELVSLAGKDGTYDLVTLGRPGVQDGSTSPGFAGRDGGTGLGF